jgi:hypothetical protein
VKKCGRCERQKIVSITLDDNIEACGHTFTARLPAEKCMVCGQVVIDGADLRRFELCVAVQLAKAGIRDKEAFAYLRKAVSLEAQGLAHILDVPEEFIGYWERGDWPVDPRAHAVLCSLVLGKIEQRPATLDCLGVLRQPRRLARQVRLQLVDALDQAARALQFGSAAHTAPALA